MGKVRDKLKKKQEKLLKETKILTDSEWVECKRIGSVLKPGVITWCVLKPICLNTIQITISMAASEYYNITMSLTFSL